MSLTKRNIQLLGAILLLCIAIALLNIFDNNAQKQTSPAKGPASDIDFFISDAQFTAFGQQGNIIRTATSDRVEHFKQSKHSLLNKPVIYSHKDLAIVASIRSETAKAIDDTDSITFYDDVRVKNIAPQTTESTLKTQILHYNRALNHVSTEADVEISDILGNITTATGMNADINLETLELKSNVKSQFTPN